MSKPIGWAIVGASGWADSTFGPAIAAANNADFVGAVGSDITKTKAYTLKHGARMAYPSLKEMLADEAVQAVWIATPTTCMPIWPSEPWKPASTCWWKSRWPSRPQRRNG